MCLRAAVVTTGKIVGFQEGIIDMSGPGGIYFFLNPQFGACNNPKGRRSTARA